MTRLNLTFLAVFAFFFSLAHERISMTKSKDFHDKITVLKAEVLWDRKMYCTVCRSIRAFFSYELLHVGAIKGLKAP